MNVRRHRTAASVLPRNLFFAMALSFGCLAATYRAAAADAPPRGPDDESTGEKLNEIVVTAQRRQENIQNVPISVQVVSGPALQTHNLNNLGDLSQVLPGVNIVSTGSTFSNDLFIRGVGSGPNPGFEQSVATFVDDVYFGRSRMIGATFLDVDRIEVLKGPQTTFFGNNAIAGALNIVTKKPGDTFDAWMRALYGMNSQYAVEGAVGGPVTDKLGVRVAATVDGQDGWIRNVLTGRSAPVTENMAMRASFSYAFNDGFDATLRLEGARNEIRGAVSDPFQWTRCPPPLPFTSGFIANCTAFLSLNLPSGLDNDENSSLPGIGSRLTDFLSELTVRGSLGEDTLTSVSAFYSYHNLANVDSANVPLLPGTIFSTTNVPEKFHQFSQEVRIESPANDRFEYMAGGYLQSNHLTESFNTNTQLLDFFAHIPGFEALGPYLPLSFQSGFKQHESTYSIFGSGTWHATDALGLSAGLRWSKVDKDAVGSVAYGTSRQLYGGLTPVPPNITAIWSNILYGPEGSQPYSRSDDGLMPSARIQYQLVPGAMVYATYSRGFKAGGFNGVVPVGQTQNILYGPEHVNAYEIGLKSEWLNRTLLLNLDAFLSDYTGLQQNVLTYNKATNADESEIRNVAKSRTKGVEFEGQWVKSDNFRLATNITYLESAYVRYPNAQQSTLMQFCSLSPQNHAQAGCSVFPFPVPSSQDLSGQPTPYAPRWSGSLAASYSALIPGNYRLTLQLSPYATSRYLTVPGDSVYSVPGYLRLDGRMTLALPGGHWAFDIIGKNLTNRVIISVPAETGFPGFAAKQEPRTVAFQARYE